VQIFRVSFPECGHGRQLVPLSVQLLELYSSFGVILSCFPLSISRLVKTCFIESFHPKRALRLGHRGPGGSRRPRPAASIKRRSSTIDYIPVTLNLDGNVSFPLYPHVC
jgi:hypothetical protein